MRTEIRETPQLRQDASPPVILVVDDEPIIRDLCIKALKEYQVLQTDSGQEALERLEQEGIDLVLTDVMMPQMNGLELLQTIKERSPNQPVVVMTGYAEKEVILQALKADADDFISKPINLLELRTTIAKVLEKRALKQELSDLKQMDRLKTEFLGMVSHKLKTPVTAISLFMQNLSRGIGDPDDPSFHKYLSLILQESRYLEYLIEDLLHFSQVILEEGPGTPQETDIKELVLSVLGELQNTASNKGVTLSSHLEGPFPLLQLDRRRIGFALRALLDNAIKFTPTSGQVSVSSAVSPRTVEIIIRDTGPGIAKEALPKVFEKFYQVDPFQTGQIRGFGLGLFYARQFVTSHGGRLTLQSSPGAGTTARLSLPR